MSSGDGGGGALEEREPGDAPQWIRLLKVPRPRSCPTPPEIPSVRGRLANRSQRHYDLRPDGRWRGPEPVVGSGGPLENPGRLFTSP